MMAANNGEWKTATVAGGCFWGVEEYYRRLKGIVDTEVGLANDDETVDPNDIDNMIEAVKLTYDPAVISLEHIIDHLFRIVDPTSYDKQGPDQGAHYRTGVFYDNSSDKLLIENTIAEKSVHYKQPIYLQARNLHHFQVADEKHQAYLANNPSAHCHVDFSLIKDDEKK
ncbi:peptide-methionine (S)-S-oxide reductase MsrA [Paenibacillus sp. R14(2021)]|uniref:peptide-methionine (S)-S-oxide reductase MsrA n=1 Tax=Paenibacillus sp. R14(2021) TaxID=2859228 RepID=UPI001C614B68|nr:peptide-methionine (S)-S-oxide reductase MsrA [Paenibacillus sp. R14(2021)]